MPPEEKKDVKEPKLPKEDPVAALKALIEAQNAKIDLLERAARGEALTMTEPGLRQCRIKFVGDEPIVNWGKSELRGPDVGAKNLYVQVYTADKDGNETEHWVSSLDLALELRSEMGTIVDEQKTTIRENYGMTEAVEVEGHRSVLKGYKVPLDVVSVQSVYTIELEDGTRFKAKKVNV